MENIADFTGVTGVTGVTSVTSVVRQCAALLGGARDDSRSLSLSKRPTSNPDPVAGLGDEELLELLGAVEDAGRFIDALRASTAGEVEERSRRELGADGLARRHGCARGTHLIEQVTRISGAEAARRVRLGAATRHRQSFTGGLLPPRHPDIARAVAEGTVGVDAAHMIVRCLDQAGRRAQPSHLASAETALVDTATTSTADLVAVHALAWREALDPDGAEPREEELRAARGFVLGRERADGMTRGTLDLDPQSAALIRTILSDGMRPRVEPRDLAAAAPDGTSSGSTSSGSAGGGSGAGGVELVDPRTRAQHQLDVLIGTLTAGMRAGRGAGAKAVGSMRPTATVMAVITLDDLESGRGAGWLDDIREPVSSITLQTVACDAGIRPIVFGTHGEVLYLGHPRRLFSRPQRLALAARDSGCVWPSCIAPPEWCEAHHVIEHEKGGKTDIDNGTLLCSEHHHMLHASAYSLEMRNGRPHLLAPPWLDPQQCWRPLGRNRALMTAIRR